MYAILFDNPKFLSPFCQPKLVFWKTSFKLFFDLNNLGTNALAFKINVNGPGKTLFITLNVGVLTCFAYSDN